MAHELDRRSRRDTPSVSGDADYQQDPAGGTRLQLALARRRLQRKQEREARDVASGAQRIPTGGGAPLRPDVRSRMEPALGADLSSVRVFTGGESAAAAASLGARAFTEDKNIHFASGGYAPGTKEGDRLLAHELAHTVQNGEGVKRAVDPAAAGTPVAPEVSQPGDPDEKAADAKADQATAQLHPDGAPAPAAVGIPPAIGKATTKTGVSVRMQPSKDGAKISELPAGTTLDVYGVSGSWLAVLPQGATTFFITAGKQYVDFTKLPPQPAPPAGGAAQPPAAEEGGGGGGLFELVGGALDAAAGVAKSAADTVSGAVSGLASSAASFFGFGDAEPTEPTPDEDAVLQEDAQKADPAFFSQRDNTFGKGGAETIDNNTNVIPDKECNVTSLAMQLVTLAGSIETVNAETISKLEAAGVATTPEMKSAQPEDLILKLFQARGEAYWKTTCAANPDFFPLMSKTPLVTFFDHYKDRSNGWHQVGLCLAWVGQEYSFTANNNGKKEGGFDEALADGSHSTTSKEYYQQTLKPKLLEGAAIMVSTDLASGHVCMLVGVEDDGVRINDPYGMHVRAKDTHLKNDDASAAKKAPWFEEDQAGIADRLKHNPELRAIADDEERRAQPVPNWGENNFFTWEEVLAKNIGKWNTVLEKEKTEKG